mmetsp:Transcript_53613/g.107662  ORF Transcript_53613/g.107662 Transcript_53613/m.107662 type:complete len:157 (-) Transcript_53613:272-742(-)
MQQSAQADTMKMAMRGMAVLMIPFTYQMPCGVFCYWSTANAFSLSQTLLLKIPSVREKLDVPLPPKPPPTPLSSSSLPGKVEPLKNPIKAMLAQVRGESLTKVPVADLRASNGSKPAEAAGDGSAAPGAFSFDDKKHVKLRVHSQKPAKKSTKKKK